MNVVFTTTTIVACLFFLSFDDDVMEIQLFGSNIGWGCTCAHCLGFPMNFRYENLKKIILFNLILSSKMLFLFFKYVQIHELNDQFVLIIVDVVDEFVIILHEYDPIVRIV